MSKCAKVDAKERKVEKKLWMGLECELMVEKAQLSRKL
jgi:hypothetical protein